MPYVILNIGPGCGQLEVNFIQVVVFENLIGNPYQSAKEIPEFDSCL